MYRVRAAIYNYTVLFTLVYCILPQCCRGGIGDGQLRPHLGVVLLSAGAGAGDGARGVLSIVHGVEVLVQIL